MTGCRHHSHGPTAEIRFVNTVPDADSIDVKVKDKSAFGNAAFGTVSEFLQVSPGAYAVESSALSSTQKAIELPPLRCTLDKDQRYTGIALGSIAESPKARLLIFPDDEADDPIPIDQAKVRVIDAYPHAGKMDVLFNAIDAFSGLTFGARSKPIQVPAKSYICKAIQNEQWDIPVEGPIPFDLKGGKSYQLVILEPPNPKQPGILVLEDK
jgi:hypothetical protein